MKLAGTVFPAWVHILLIESVIKLNSRTDRICCFGHATKEIWGVFLVEHITNWPNLFDYAVALTLIGGVQHVDASGAKIRGESHLLLVGDPGKL